VKYISITSKDDTKVKIGKFIESKVIRIGQIKRKQDKDKKTKVQILTESKEKVNKVRDQIRNEERMGIDIINDSIDTLKILSRITVGLSYKILLFHSMKRISTTIKYI